MASVSIPGPANLDAGSRGVFAEPLSRRESINWLWLVLAGFVGGYLVSEGLVLLTAAVLGRSGEVSRAASAAVPPEWFVVSSLVGLWVGFLGAPFLATRIGPVRRRLGVSVKPIDLLGIPIGIAAQIAVGILYAPFMQHLHNFDAPIKRLTGGSHGIGLVVIVAFTAVLAPIAEEVFFRGLLFRSLLGFAVSLGERRRQVGIIGAVIADGIIFGLAHFEPVQFPGLFLVGALLSFLFLRTGRLGMSMFAHCAFNSVALVGLISSSGLIQP